MFFCGGTSTIDHYSGTFIPGDDGWIKIMSESFLPTQSSSKDTHPNKPLTHARALLGIFTGVPDVPVFWFMAMYAVAIRIHMARYHKPCVGRRCWISGRFSLHWLKRRCELEMWEISREWWRVMDQSKPITYIIHAIYTYIHIIYIYIHTYTIHDLYVPNIHTHTLSIYIYIYTYIYIYILYTYIYIYIYYTYLIHIYIWIMHENVWSCLSSSGTDAVFLSPI